MEIDDVLTLLIHLGYLAYDEKTEKVHIPIKYGGLNLTAIKKSK